jgi:glycosyltransferase involved in cell wall biosynthesis
MISCIIPCLNEPPESLGITIENLTDGMGRNDMELILVNDGSVNSDGTPQTLDWVRYANESDINIIVMENQKRHGVGWCFDRGVELASGETIVLLGADVYPKRRSWLYDVKNMVKQASNEIGCCCSVGLSPGNYDIEKADLYHRYGAKLLYTIGVDDLPKNSPLRKDPNYRDILAGQFQPKKADEPYEISCLMGAMYWMKREDYVRIHGFDTEKGVHFRGARFWGCLEPHLSLKAKVYGMRLVEYPSFKVGHTFSRIDDIYKVRAVRNDITWWNKLWCVHTMFKEELREELLAYPCHSLNLSQAKAYIKQNWSVVQEVRERNKREGKLISE